MSANVSTSTIFDDLKDTLDTIITDKEYGQSQWLMPKYFKQKGMTDYYHDDLEMQGLGLASEVDEGEELPHGTIGEGYITRYLARKFGLKMSVTEEAMEDKKHDKVIDAAMRLRRAMGKTIDIDAALTLVRGWNSDYIGGDGQPLFSASHTVKGGTFSNTLAVPYSPSKVGITIMTSAIRKLPGHDGEIEGYEPKRVLCPTEQWAIWEELTESKKDPTAGAFNAVNVVNGLGLDVLPIKYWTNTTTNWAIQTDCPNGLMFRFRRRPRSKSWVENSHELMFYSVSARWARGWSDPRCIFGSQA